MTPVSIVENKVSSLPAQPPPPQGKSVVDESNLKTPKLNDIMLKKFNTILPTDDNGISNESKLSLGMKEEHVTLINDPIYKFLVEQNKKDQHLHVSTPKFSGNVKEDVEDWLLMVKQGFISKILDEDRLNAVVNFVSDLPLLILKKHIQFSTYTSSWYEFEKELKETFESVLFVEK